MSFERKNLAYIVRKADDKFEEMLHILNSVSGSAIVYVRSRKRSKEIAAELCKRKISATYYNAGLESAARDERQKEWHEGKARVMVATNAFGMGIDKPDVRLVIHHDCLILQKHIFRKREEPDATERKPMPYCFITAATKAN